MSHQTFNILSIDGGGIRGVYSAAMLKFTHERLGVNAAEHFDMIAGTSTGSIIAAGLTTGLSPNKLLRLYKTEGSSIFGTKTRSFLPAWLKPGFRSTYENRPLLNILKSALGEVTLGDIERPLIIPATDAGNGGVHVFKSAYSDEFTRDKNVLLSEAVLASCSAPIYFDPSQVGNYLLTDGGLWANNPTMVAIIDAQYRLGVNLADIRVLSLGTGHSKVAYGANPQRSWGLLNGWKHKNFISFLLSLQSQSINNYSTLMLNENILRLDFESDSPLPLDDPGIVDDLIARADKDFTYRSQQIREFLHTTAEVIHG